MVRFRLVAAVAASAFVFAAAPAPAQDRAVPQSRSEVRLSYSPVVKQVSPAVVNVYAQRVVSQRPRGFPFDDPLFREFFGGQSPFNPRERVQQSLGSGVIVGRDGTIVTNYHVVDGMTEVRVALVDQREFDVDVVLTDQRADLAVLKVRNPKVEFPMLPLGDPEQLEVGDIVLAVGNPYGLGQTVTSGIVSAIRRVQLSEGEQRVYIQTDAAINQGNSGGALVDMQGRLVGVNTAIFSKSGGSDGIGFAVPASVVRTVIEAAQRGDKVVRRPWLGAELQGVNREIAETLSLDRPRGALVAEVDSSSPAGRAGLKAGDLVTALEGRAVEDPTQLTYLFSTRPFGASVPLTVRRDGRDQTVAVKVEPAPETPPRDLRALNGGGPFTGAKVANLSPAVAEELGISGQSKGVVVMSVEPGSIAQRLGIQAGDRVVALNDQRIESTRELERVNGQRQAFWKVAIGRGGQILTQVFRF